MNFPLTADDVLKPHRWQHRLLLVFSPRADDLRAREYDERLADFYCDLEDRDIIVGWVPAFGDARLDGAVLTPDLAFQLRRKFNVDVDEFAVVLIGKDGLEKSRSITIADLENTFRLIDTMPMRKAEMRERGGSCAESM